VAVAQAGTSPVPGTGAHFGGSACPVSRQGREGCWIQPHPCFRLAFQDVVCGLLDAPSSVSPGNEPPLPLAKPGMGCPRLWASAAGNWTLLPQHRKRWQAGDLGASGFGAGLDKFTRILVAAENQRLRYNCRVQDT